jgi:hypothetical protein
MDALPILLTDHARRAIHHRHLDEATVVAVARDPEQTIAVNGAREIRQGRRQEGPDLKTYLIRVIVETTPTATLVITAYRTSRIAKYWRIT